MTNKKSILKKILLQKFFIILILSSFYSFLLVIFRIFYSQGSVRYLFLNWNLFLAWIPLIISVLLNICSRKRYPKQIQIILFLTWIVFFPNSLYIITDLFHLKPTYDIAFWFDLILIMSFAWNGLIVGFVSLIFIEDFIVQKTKESKYAKAVAIISLFLASFGIYVGRYLRWNSWDILTNPISLFYDIFSHIFDPISHFRSIGMTLFFAAFLILAYSTIRSISKDKLIK
ncbi:MAG: DUF1361 domain-containing protein [Candidatus Moranbacteria bacterium]|nr:DUF1361 domain-containing protein [Candidatus Moranbacteria bacterium]